MDKYGIAPEDARKLRYLLQQLTFPSYKSHLSFKKAEEQDWKAEIKSREARLVEQEEYALAYKKIIDVPKLPDHPIINKLNIDKIFGLSIDRIYYENPESKTDTVFHIYRSLLEERDLLELSDRLLTKQIQHTKQTIKGGRITEQYIELKGDAVYCLKELMQVLLLPDSQEPDQIEHPVFNRKNIKDKLDIAIASVVCFGDKNSSITEKLTINFKTPYGEQLNKLVDILGRKDIAYSHPFSADYIIISDENIGRFIDILGGTEIDWAKEFHRYRASLPKNHKILFDKENIKKTFPFLYRGIFEVEYHTQDFLWETVSFRFDRQNWEYACILSNSLKKTPIMHNKERGLNYLTIIVIGKNNMSEFINLLIKNLDIDLIKNSDLEEKVLINEEKIKIPHLAELPARLFITKQAIANKFGEKIADSIEQIDLSNYSLIGFVMIMFVASDSAEIHEFCRILKKNAIVYVKSGPENRTIFLQNEQACRSLEALLLSSNQPSIDIEVTKEDVMAALDLENVALVEENKEGGIKIVFTSKSTLLNIKILESDLARDGILSVYTESGVGSGFHQKIRCIKIPGDSKIQFIQLVKKKNQEKICVY